MGSLISPSGHAMRARPLARRGRSAAVPSADADEFVSRHAYRKCRLALRASPATRRPRPKAGIHFWDHALFVLELRRPLLDESRHAFLLVGGREQGIEHPAFEAEALGKRRFEGAIDGFLGGEHRR